MDILQINFNTNVKQVVHHFCELFRPLTLKFRTNLFLGWNVHVQQKGTTNTSVHTFDKVMVATGPFRSPIVPDIPGTKEFKGSIIHAKDFRLKSTLKGKRVVVIGKWYILFCTFAHGKSPPMCPVNFLHLDQHRRTE